MLQPCAECNRLVRATDAACPFCTAAMRPTVIAAGPLVRRARAAVFATAALSAATTHPTLPVAMYGGPPMP